MARVQPSRHAYAITVFLILLVCSAYFMPKWADWGANSRADLVYAVGDRGVLYIDDYHENTGDKACFAGTDYAGDTPCEDGHYYTDKSLGPSLVALPFYMIFKSIAALPPFERFIESSSGLGNFGDTLNPDGEGIRPEAVYQGMALTFITFFAMAVPSALLGAVVFLFAARFTRKNIYAFVLALAYGLGTIAYPYSNVLYQHQMASFGMFTGFFLLWRVIYEDASPNWLWLVGLLFSLAVITEYPVVPFLTVILIWAFIKMPTRWQLYRVILAGIPLGIIFMAFNYLTFETIMPVGYNYSINWQEEHQTGFLSLTMPNLARFYGLSFSPIRGIFVLSPFLLLFFPGAYAMWKQRRDQQDVLIVCVLMVIGFFFYNGSSIMWWGGFTVGPRYLIPMLPFMVLPISFAFNWLLQRAWGQVVTALLIAISIFSVGSLTIAGQAWPDVTGFPNTIEQMNASYPLVDHALPLLAQGNVARNYGGIFLNLNGLAGLIPLLVAVIAILLIVPRLFSTPNKTLKTNTLEQATENLR